MSNKPYKGFEPNWLLTPAPENSYRSIFRWGDPNFFKYPKESLYTLMKEKFQMTDPITRCSLRPSTSTRSRRSSASRTSPPRTMTV